MIFYLPLFSSLPGPPVLQKKSPPLCSAFNLEELGLEEQLKARPLKSLSGDGVISRWYLRFGNLGLAMAH